MAISAILFYLVHWLQHLYYSRVLNARQDGGGSLPPPKGRGQNDTAETLRGIKKTMLRCKRYYYSNSIKNICKIR